MGYKLPRKLIAETDTYLDDQAERWANSVRPYKQPLNYERFVSLVTEKTGPYVSFGPRSRLPVVKDSRLRKYYQYAYNKAYDRFVGKLGDSSSFGATVTAERRESFGMITMLATNALRAGRCAKRGDILGVLHNLGFNPPLKQVTRTYPRKRGKRVRVKEEYYRMPDGRMVVKAAGSSWLLYSYGIAPLLSDIQNATEVFVRDQPNSTVIKSGATERYNLAATIGDTRPDNQWTRQEERGSVRVGITGSVSVSNSDIWLATQLGLTNPLQWLNEAVPFSFVIDWFSNWSSVINSLSDFGGLTITNSCHSSKGLHAYSFRQTVTLYNGSYKHIGSFTGTHIHFQRTTGIAAPKLVFRYERFEWRRALNAISLLVGFLPKTQK